MRIALFIGNALGLALAFLGCVGALPFLLLVALGIWLIGLTSRKAGEESEIAPAAVRRRQVLNAAFPMVRNAA
jgi:hypothetical protein